VGRVLGLIDASSALEALATKGGGGGAGVTAAILLSPVYFIVGARNGMLLGAPLGASVAWLLGGLATVYLGQPGRLGLSSTWIGVRLVAGLAGVVASAAWVSAHPGAVFSLWQ